MLKDLRGKTAVVTGGASGIGRSIAQALVNEGCNVAIADRDGDRAAQAAQELIGPQAGTLGVACDVTVWEQVEALRDVVCAEFSDIDLVFCNAGVMPTPAPFLETPQSDARWAFEINYFGVWNTAQVFARYFAAREAAAHVVITGSENSICVPAPLFSAYNPSKHAVLGLAETLRLELPEHIGVSILCPGMVKTSLTLSIEARPSEFGGPQVDELKGEMPYGLDADAIGAHTVAQLKEGKFYIVTHHCVGYMVEERYAELAEAFQEQTHPDDGSADCDTRKIVAAHLATL